MAKNNTGGVCLPHAKLAFVLCVEQRSGIGFGLGVCLVVLGLVCFGVFFCLFCGLFWGFYCVWDFFVCCWFCCILDLFFFFMYWCYLLLAESGIFSTWFVPLFLGIYMLGIYYKETDTSLECPNVLLHHPFKKDYIYFEILQLQRSST